MPLCEPSTSRCRRLVRDLFLFLQLFSERAEFGGKLAAAGLNPGVRCGCWSSAQGAALGHAEQPPIPLPAEPAPALALAGLPWMRLLGTGRLALLWPGPWAGGAYPR